jgi:hypothetical protein
MHDEQALRTLRQLVEQTPLPNYGISGQRSLVGQANDRAYNLRRLLLQQHLEALDQPKALCELHRQQMDQVKYFLCFKHDDFFTGQFNAGRADRSGGAGRKLPPAGVQTKEAPQPSCFLCVDNVRWQQRGIQLFHEFDINARPYVALCNPFPFMPVHMTIASAAHEPQSWRECSTGDVRAKIARIIGDLYHIKRPLPEFVGFYNGVGAGATIERHLHYHLFQVPSGHQLFPLQRAAAKTIAQIQTDSHPHSEGADIASCLDISNYPLRAFRLHGPADDVVRQAVTLVEKWDQLCGDAASANIIAISEHDSIAIYFVPRNRFFSRSPGLSGLVGGLECLGEFVFSSDAENQAINEQRVNYEYMWSILQAVRPPNVQRLA